LEILPGKTVVSKVMTSPYTLTANKNVLLLDSGNKMLWRKWLLIISVISIAYATTLQVAPFLHMDELLTVELGRIILHPRTNWSIAWMCERNQPSFFIFYLGPVLQEAAYQIMGQYGPRIIALLSALMAATVLLKWLLVRGVKGNAAMILALIFLLDPLFVQAFTLGRPDGLTLACCMAACLMIEQATQHPYTIRYIKIRTLLAGVFTATALFTWPSAIFLFPLVCIMLLNLVVRLKQNGYSVKNVFIPVFYFVAGALLTSVLLVAPVAVPLMAQLDNLVAGMKINSKAGPLFGEHSGLLSKLAPAIELLRVIKFTPFLILVSLASIIWRRNIGLAVALLAAIVLMLCTVVYIHRVLYLLPYLVLAVSELFRHGNYITRKALPRMLKTGTLALLLIWSVGLSLFARTAVAVNNRTDASRFVIAHAAQSMQVHSKQSVLLLNAYEFYYTGRSLGWRMYAPYASMGDSLTTAELQQVLPHVDCAIIVNWKVTESLAGQLKKEGLEDKGLYYTYRVHGDANDGNVSNNERLRSLYRIVPQPYGPYRLFTRNPKSVAIHSHK
jgi:hypothetical protein